MSELVERALMIGVGVVMFGAALVWFTPVLDLVGLADRSDAGGTGSDPALDPPWIFTELQRALQFVQDFPEYRHQRANVYLPATIELGVVHDTCLACWETRAGQVVEFTHEVGAPLTLSVRETPGRTYTLYVFRVNATLLIAFR